MSENSPTDDPEPLKKPAFPAEFRSAVGEALAGVGYSIVDWESEGINVLAPEAIDDSGDREHYIGMANLYRRVKLLERSEWPGAIGEFLQHIARTLSGPKIPDDLHSIASQLRPRLGRPFSREGKQYPWGIPLPGTGLEINLAVDYPNTMAYVTEEMLKKSRTSGEALLEVALASLREHTPADFFEKASDELDLLIGHCGDGYDAARALLIEDLLSPPAAGFLVAIPSREELAVWPVSLQALEKIHALKIFAEENFREHAYPVTEDVFWLQRGTWYPFGIEFDDKDVTLSPPEEFVAALNALGSAGTRSQESATPDSE